MIFIGVDPGAGGGIAAMTCPEIVRVFPMPATERDAIDLLTSFSVKGSSAVIEHVWSIPGQGGGFNFGVNVGMLRTALTAARIPFTQVLPKRWQQALGIVYRKGATDTEKKNITKRRAQQLFPHVKVTHAIADALLLAEYARQQEMGSRRVKR